VSYLSEGVEEANGFSWINDFYQFTPLSYACERNRLEIAKALLANKLSGPVAIESNDRVNLVDPVYTAVGHENAELVQLLAEAGFPCDIAYNQLQAMGGEAILKGKILKLFQYLRDFL